MANMGSWWGDEWIEGDGQRGRERYRPVTVSEADHYRFLHEVGVCAATGRQGVPIEVAHLPGNDAMFGKTAGGMGQKTHFVFCIPLGIDIHDAETSREAYRKLFQRLNWPLEDVAGGPYPTAMALVAFSALGDADAARRWLVKCAIERKAR